MLQVCLACKAVSLAINPWQIQGRCIQVVKISSNTCSSKISRVRRVACKAGRLSLKVKEEVGVVTEVVVPVKSWITPYVKDVSRFKVWMMHSYRPHNGSHEVATQISIYPASITRFGME